MASRPSRDWTRRRAAAGAGEDHQALAVGEGEEFVGVGQVALGEVGQGERRMNRSRPPGAGPSVVCAEASGPTTATSPNGCSRLRRRIIVAEHQQVAASRCGGTGPREIPAARSRSNTARRKPASTPRWRSSRRRAQRSGPAGAARPRRSSRSSARCRPSAVAESARPWTRSSTAPRRLALSHQATETAVAGASQVSVRTGTRRGRPGRRPPAPPAGSAGTSRKRQRRARALRPERRHQRARRPARAPRTPRRRSPGRRSRRSAPGGPTGRRRRGPAAASPATGRSAGPAGPGCDRGVERRQQGASNPAPWTAIIQAYQGGRDASAIASADRPGAQARAGPPGRATTAPRGAARPGASPAPRYTWWSRTTGTATSPNSRRPTSARGPAPAPPGSPRRPGRPRPGGPRRVGLDPEVPAVAEQDRRAPRPGTGSSATPAASGSAGCG